MRAPARLIGRGLARAGAAAERLAALVETVGALQAAVRRHSDAQEREVFPRELAGRFSPPRDPPAVPT